MIRKIIIRNIEKPQVQDVGDSINWFCDSFALSAGRDINNISSQIVQALLYELAEQRQVSSETVAQNLRMPVSRVNYHIRNLIDAGLLYRQKRMLRIRGGSLKAAVREMRKDAERMFAELEEIAGEIDRSLHLQNQ